MHTVIPLLLTVLALTGVASARPPLECVTVTSVDGTAAALVPESSCTIATHPAAASILPDLTFAPPLCFVTTFTGKLTIDGRDTDGFSVIAFSGVSTNTTGAALATMPSPLVDGQGNPRPLIPFAAATIIEVRSEAKGTLVGQLVTRDTGWGELDLTTALPKFATERLVVTSATGPLFKGARGEIVFSGDQFGLGGTARGSLCGPRLKRRIEQTLR